MKGYRDIRGMQRRKKIGRKRRRGGLALSSLFLPFKYRQYSRSLSEIAGAEVVGSTPTCSISFCERTTALN
jgi:hypothetical protein